MNIWLVEVGETLPLSLDSNIRLRRIGLLSKILVQAGHKVTWWASSFDHYSKRHVVDNDKTIFPYYGLAIRALRGYGYSRNFSLMRMVDYSVVGVKFHFISRTSDKPDLILCGFPSIELSAASVYYGLKHNVPVILDVKDMWPDIFFYYVPAILRPVMRLATWPMYQMTRWACSRATAITGMTDAFVNWGLLRGNRAKTPLDRSFPFAYSKILPSSKSLNDAEYYWDSRNVHLTDKERTVCFIGSIGHQLDLNTIVKAARSLLEMGKSIKIIVCGTGDLLNYYRDKTKDLRNILFPGWVGAAEIYLLMRRSYAGLDPLPDRFDFLSSINNKAIEYLSAGLPLISSPMNGTLKNLIYSNHVGLCYECGDHERLAHILVELSENTRLQKILSTNALSLYESKFVAENVYQEMKEYLEQIVSNNITKE